MKRKVSNLIVFRFETLLEPNPHITNELLRFGVSAYHRLESIPVLAGSSTSYADEFPEAIIPNLDTIDMLVDENPIRPTVLIGYTEGNIGFDFVNQAFPDKSEVLLTLALNGIKVVKYTVSHGFLSPDGRYAAFLPTHIKNREDVSNNILDF